MDEKDIKKVKVIISNRIELSEPNNIIKNDDLLSDLGMNSFVFIKIVVDLEEAFGIEFDPDIMLEKNFQTVTDFISYIQKTLHS